MRNVKIAKHITLTLSADDWGLYDSNHLRIADCVRDITAEWINDYITDAINEGRQYDAREVLRTYSDWGANDSKGINTLVNILDLFNTTHIIRENTNV